MKDQVTRKKSSLVKDSKTKSKQKKTVENVDKSMRTNSSEKTSDEILLEKLNRLARANMEKMGLDVGNIVTANRPNPDSLEVSDSEESTFSSACEETELPAISQPFSKGPEVVVFDSTKVAPIKTNIPRGGYKSFLSSSIKKLDAERSQPVVQTKESKKEDLNLKFDAELENLLSSSNLIERLAASELTGKDRRKFQLEQLTKLGAKPMKKAQNPINYRFQQINIKKRKTEEAISKAKEEGNYHKSIKHLFQENEAPKKKRSKGSSGLKTSMGKFNDGVLHISGAHIRRNARLAKKKKP